GTGADSSRPGTPPNRHVQSPQLVQARSLNLPVLRLPARHRGIDDRSRHSARTGGPDDLGKLCTRMRSLQREEGESNSGPSRNEASTATSPPLVETALRRSRNSDRELVALPERCLLECAARKHALRAGAATRP